MRAFAVHRLGVVSNFQELAQMANFPERARVVIIGQGGIVGASVVHHLIERGWDNMVGID